MVTVIAAFALANDSVAGVSEVAESGDAGALLLWIGLGILLLGTTVVVAAAIRPRGD